MNVRARVLLSMLGIVLLAGACSDRAGRPSEDALPILTARLDLRIDGNENDLVPINWLGVSPAGRIALIQWQDYTVRFFDDAGRLLGSAGREGEGPGEFRRPIRGGWIGDTLWIHDTQINRVTLIGPDLDIVGMFTPPPTVIDSTGATLYRSLFPWGMLSRDSLVVTALFAVDGPATGTGNGYPILVVNADGRSGGELVRYPADESSAIVRVDKATFGAPIPFQARTSWTVSPDGRQIAILTTDMTDIAAPSYRVRSFDAHGAQLADRVFPFAPVPIPAERMDSAIAASPAMVRHPELKARFEEALRAAAPKIHAAAERVVIGADGRLWIGLRQEAEGRPWLVLAPDAEPLARVLLPGNVTLQAANATHIWAVERDELDVESVVRYALSGAGPQPD